jgi:hypothetical protein
MDWWKLVGEIVAMASGLAGVVAIFLHYAQPADAVERWVGEDREYRSELAVELKGGRLGTLYQHALAYGLGWFDQRFGPANSSRALGICIIIALYYAYGAFLIGWGVGGPDDIGGVQLLPEALAWSDRLLLALGLTVVLPLAFLFGRKVGRLERRLNLWLRRRRKWHRRQFELLYRGTWFAVIFLALLIILLLNSSNSPEFAGVFIFCMACALGPVFGVLVATRLKSDLIKGLAGAGAAAFIVAAAFVVAGAFVRGVLVTLAGAGAGAVAIAVGGAFVGAAAFVRGIVLAVTVAGSVTVAVAVARAFVFAGGGIFFGDLAGVLAVAVTVTVAIGAVVGSGQQHKGAFAGGIGALGGLGLLLLIGSRQGNRDLVILLILFFLLLPLVNGLWDWLSWWVSPQASPHFT